MSREHYFSQSVWLKDQPIKIKGLPWCVDKPQVVPLSGMTAKVLCRHHNSALSPLDEGAGSAMRVLKDSYLEGRKPPPLWVPHPPLIKPSVLDGNLLERWFLKMLTNLFYLKEVLIGERGQELGQVPADLVRICFGLDRFQPPAGLYCERMEGTKLGFQGELETGGLLHRAPGATADRLLGGFFMLWGFKFVMLIEQEGKAWALPEGLVMRHPAQIVRMQGPHEAEHINFVWGD